MRVSSLIAFCASLAGITSAAAVEPRAVAPPEVPAEIAQIITRKKLQYARFADTRQWDMFDQVSLPECTYKYTSHGEQIVDHGYTYKWDSTAEFTAFFSMAFATLETVHHVGPGEITYTRWPDEIQGIFPVVYYSGLAKGVNETQGVTGVGGGHYINKYTRKGLDWFMSECTMNRIYEQ